MAAAHGGKLPLPLQLPGERGLLLSCIVCLGDKVWISLFSPSHFDLTPIQDSWYRRWTWHSTVASVEIWNGKRRMGLRGMGLKASVSAVLCARQTQWPSWLNSAEKVTARTEQEKSPEGKQMSLHFYYVIFLSQSSVNLYKFVSASWLSNYDMEERMS